MRLWKGSLIVLLLTMLMAVAPVAAADDPATVLQRFTAARNSGDFAGAIALLADTVRFVEGAICSPDSPCIGPAAVRPFLEESIPLHVVLTAAGAPQVSGATVRQRFEVRGDPFAPAGIGRFVGDATVEVRDGKIVSYINVPDTSDAQTARYLASPPVQGPPPAQGPPSAPPRTGGGGEASFIHRLGDASSTVRVVSIVLAASIAARNAASPSTARATAAARAMLTIVSSPSAPIAPLSLRVRSFTGYALT